MPTADTAYVYNRRGLPMTVTLVDLTTGRRTPVMTVASGRPPESGAAFTLRISADARTYVYSYFQRTSELFLMQR